MLCEMVEKLAEKTAALREGLAAKIRPTEGERVVQATGPPSHHESPSDFGQIASGIR